MQELVDEVWRTANEKEDRADHRNKGKARRIRKIEGE